MPKIRRHRASNARDRAGQSERSTDGAPSTNQGLLDRSGACRPAFLAANGDSRRLARAGGVKGAAGAASARAKPVCGRTTLEAARPREHNEKARAANPIAVRRVPSPTRPRNAHVGTVTAIANRVSGGARERTSERERACAIAHVGLTAAVTAAHRRGASAAPRFPRPPTNQPPQVHTSVPIRLRVRLRFPFRVRFPLRVRVRLRYFTTRITNASIPVL